MEWWKTDWFRFIAVSVSLVVGLVAFWYWQLNDIVVSHLNYQSPEIPPGFEGYKILQVSDLHNKEFGADQSRLVEQTRRIDPDIIVVTGDLFYGDDLSLDHTMEYLRQAVNIAPVYFISGNHDLLYDMYPTLLAALKSAGVIILDNDRTELTRDGDTIQLLGIKDPSYGKKQKETMQKYLAGIWNKDEKCFSILLSHRPEGIKIYASQNIDLVFTGHAHGGMIRIPYLGGLFAPNQGLFPHYTSGMYTLNNTTMVVSRGLGNSAPSLRVFNRPELVLLTLHNGEKLSTSQEVTG